MIEEDQLIRHDRSLAAIVPEWGCAWLWYHPWSDDVIGTAWDDLISQLAVLGYTKVPEQVDSAIDEYVVWLLRKDADDHLPHQRGKAEAPQLLRPVDTR